MSDKSASLGLGMLGMVLSVSSAISVCRECKLTQLHRVFIHDGDDITQLKEAIYRRFNIDIFNCVDCTHHNLLSNGTSYCSALAFSPSANVNSMLADMEHKVTQLGSLVGVNSMWNDLKWKRVWTFCDRRLKI